MNEHELVIRVFLATSVFFALAICLPDLLKALGIDGYRNQVYGGPSDLDPEGKGPVYADLHAQLLALGFEPLGIHREAVIGHKGKGEFEYVRRSDQCLATVWRLAGGDPRVSFKTVFLDGAVAFTANYSREHQATSDYLGKSLPSNSLATVLEEHRTSVARFQSVGRVPREIQTLEDVAEVQRAYFYNPSVRRHYQNAEWAIFGAKAISLGMTAGAIWLLLIGFVSFPIAWATALLLASIGWVILEKYLMRQATRELSDEQRQADEARRLDAPQ